MPVILKKDNEHRWLQDIDIQEAQSMLEPYPLDDLKVYPISTLVNNPRNNSKDVIRPLWSSKFLKIVPFRKDRDWLSIVVLQSIFPSSKFQVLVRYLVINISR